MRDIPQNVVDCFDPHEQLWVLVIEPLDEVQPRGTRRYMESGLV